ncbi:MAG TPA: primosomal protein N' [Candidatus Gracilibacteria bacterium]|nr:primosomal protein N' [Candidatus Gracilibacteria bacterium]
MYAVVAFQQKIGERDFLTYKIPDSLLPNLRTGMLVEIPLRKAKKTGLIWEINDKEPPFKTVEISGIIGEEPLLTSSQIELIKFISEYYFTPLFKVLKLFIPAKIFKGKEMRLNKRLTAKGEKIPTKKEFKTLSDDQQKVFDKIIAGIENSENTTKNSAEQKNSTKAVSNSKEASQVNNLGNDLKNTNKDLTENNTKTTRLNKFLIHGITGSGKTEIYAHLARYFLEKGKQVLILVPEISLTPQTVEYFESRIQFKAAVIHSRLSEGEKFKMWKDIKSNKKNLVIGSRSSIFSPFTNLGIIIIDEEHELSYKQDQAPRYHAHTIAEKIQDLEEKRRSQENTEMGPRILPIVLGSATPSIETAYKYRDSTLTLRERIGASQLPDISIIDMREEFKKGNKSIFSDDLNDAIERTLAQNKQVILFLNRRGSASSIVCRDCGYKLTCSECDIPMTYHARTMGHPVVICHHCGKIGKIPINCPVCAGLNIRFLGIGTERIEEETKKLFKNARILRADKDTTSHKDSFEQIYSSFKKHEADILIGTQMIAKGLHIPNVGLVGVVLADIGLNMPDFRTSERNFQLLTQVAGRAGRSNEKGQVIIQTYSPDHFALQAATTHDYNAFYQSEKSQRGILNYPPFSNLAVLSIENKNFNKAKLKAEELELKLKNFLNNPIILSQQTTVNQETGLNRELTSNHQATDLKSQITELTCYPAFVMKLHGKYRYRILIKSKTSEAIQSLLKNFAQNSAPKVLDEVKIDIDPISTN